MNSTSPNLDQSVLAAVHAGNKIEAIRLLRAANGLGLKEAKDTVERYIATQPDLLRRYDELQARGMKRMRWILALFAVVIAWELWRKG